MNHSPEPWGCHDQGTPSPTICKERGDGSCHEIAELTGCQGMSHEELLANGDRIVACVNACAGIPTEKLQEWADWLKNAPKAKFPEFHPLAAPEATDIGYIQWVQEHAPNAYENFCKSLEQKP